MPDASLFFMVRAPVEEAISNAMQQKSKCEEHHGLVKKARDAVVEGGEGAAGWVGADATQYGIEVVKRILPAMLELAAAFMGVNLNLTQAIAAVDAADKEVNSIVDGVTSAWNSI